MSNRRSLVAVLVLGSLLGLSLAQAPTKLVDPASAGPLIASPTSGGHLFVQGSGGEVIGYTTGSVTPHFKTLPAMGEPFDDLVAQGHTLVPINQLVPSALANLDRLVVGLVDPNAVLSVSQLDAVADFVRHGGKLVFLGENFNFLANNQAVGERFRFDFPGQHPGQIVLTQVNPHPITQGPHGVVTVVDGTANNPGFFGSIEAPGPRAYSLVDFDAGESMAVVLEPGAFAPNSGLVVAFSEIDIWDTLSGYHLGDNRALFLNTFAYAPPSPNAAVSIRPGLAAWIASSQAE